MNIENYNVFAKARSWSGLVEHNGAGYGYWLIGRWYNTTKGGKYYYGAYPPSYLDRIFALFPGYKNKMILHLFSGTIRGNGKNEITLDIKSEVMPNIVANALSIDSLFKYESFDLILADPPYEDNWKKYGTDKISIRKVIHKSSKIIKDGGFLVWLDTIIPQWRKEDGWRLKGLIGLGQSTNHRTRVITILQKGDVPIRKIKIKRMW